MIDKAREKQPVLFAHKQRLGVFLVILFYWSSGVGSLAHLHECVFISVRLQFLWAVVLASFEWKSPKNSYLELEHCCLNSHVSLSVLLAWKRGEGWSWLWEPRLKVKHKFFPLSAATRTNTKFSFNRVKLFHESSSWLSALGSFSICWCC